MPRMEGCWSSYAESLIPKGVEAVVENAGTRDAVLRLKKLPPQRWVVVPVKSIFYETAAKSG